MSGLTNSGEIPMRHKLVTVGEYVEFLRQHRPQDVAAYVTAHEDASAPATYVSWYDAQAWCAANPSWRLPTEQEWLHVIKNARVQPGDVWEWVGSPSDNGRVVVRGGSWDVDIWTARSAYRSGYHPDDRFNDLGFRVVGAVGARQPGDWRLSAQTAAALRALSDAVTADTHSSSSYDDILRRGRVLHAIGVLMTTCGVFTE